MDGLPEPILAQVFYLLAHELELWTEARRRGPAKPRAAAKRAKPPPPRTSLSPTADAMRAKLLKQYDRSDGTYMSIQERLAIDLSLTETFREAFVSTMKARYPADASPKDVASDALCRQVFDKFWRRPFNEVHQNHAAVARMIHSVAIEAAKTLHKVRPSDDACVSAGS